jgi:hypothetical protein
VGGGLKAVERRGSVRIVMFGEGAADPRLFRAGDGAGKAVLQQNTQTRIFELLTGGQKMNIKSLLLGSAAASLVAVTGAQAADPIIYAEPEPMEYVRICDVYGTGFYYIPGTETCLRIGGYVRYDIGVGAHGLYGDLYETDVDGDPVLVGDYDTYYKRARLGLQVDARSETELGTLRGYAHINFQHTTAATGTFTFDTVTGDVSYADSIGGVSEVGYEHIYIELGGFRVGFTDSLFSTFQGYGSGLINDGIIEYGPFGTHQIAYTFAGGNGFTAAVALENGSTYGQIDDHMPHVIAGVGFSQGWGGVSAVIGYDSVAEDWAGKVRLDANLTPGISAFVLAGYDNDGATALGTWAGEWMVQGGVSATVTPQATINAMVGYEENFGDGFWAAGANVAYELVPGFVITPEVTYQEANDGREFGGFLRFQRNF